MRILALATEAFGGFGGIAQANRDFFEALAGAGHTVFILPRQTKKNTGNLPANITQAAASENEIIYSLRAFGILARRGPFDLIFCGHLFMTPLAWILSRVFSVPYWVQLYGIEAWTRSSTAVQRTVEKADTLTAISRYTRRRFLSWATVEPEKIKVLPCTYGTRFAPGLKSEELLQRYGLNGKKVILTVGRILATEKYKGHDRIISALPEVIREHPDTRYVIVGEGSDRSRLESLAKDKAVEKQVIFIGDVPDVELPEWYRSCDVFAMPSTGEGFGIVFLEAAASGIPVIGGGRDGSQDALREGRIGLTVDPENSVDLARAIKRSLVAGTGDTDEVQKFSKPKFEKHVTDLANRLLLCSGSQKLTNQVCEDELI